MNKLKHEASPYLRQHANNPVEWFPYGEDALREAKEKNKLIFLSIGYSSCHWCHVMARESFQDEKVANYMNTNFISIKVDREERPGLDKVMQELYQLTNKRGGGWPLSVWMTPDAKPIFLGTYFPNSPRHGLPSFQQLNERIVELWETQRSGVIQQAENISKGTAMLGMQVLSGRSEIEEDVHSKILSAIMRRVDRKYGGIGAAPKFPRVSTLTYLLSEGVRKGDSDMVNSVEFSYLKMIRGGFYDQLDGGFARYSVDTKWLVPHFEKMLYDNGALLSLGADLYAVTSNKEIEKALYKTIDWLEKEMLSKSGGFTASMNAESEGEEGKFYVWTQQEISDLLGEDMQIACMYFGITKKGNFKDPHHPEKLGMNILSICSTIENLAEEFSLPPEDIQDVIDRSITKMIRFRDKRIKPDLDDKIISSWNGIMISGLINVHEKTGDLRSLRLAEGAIRNLRSHFRDGYILRYTKEGDEREIQGVLDDYAFTIDALLRFFEVSGDTSYLDDADVLAKIVIRKFYDAPALYLIPNDHEDAIFGRPIQVTDDSMAAALSVMVRNFFKLSKYTEQHDYYNVAEDILSHTIETAIQYPGSASELLMASRYFSEYPDEIVYLGEGAIGKEFPKYYLPTRLVYRVPSFPPKEWEVLEGRKLIGEETLYLCRGQTCSLPITELNKLAELIETKNIGI